MPMPGSKELEPTDTHTRDADRRRNSLTNSEEVNTNTITSSQTNLTSSGGGTSTSANGIRFELTYPTIDDAGTLSRISISLIEYLP